jgi:serine/threonine protein kinase
MPPPLPPDGFSSLSLIGRGACGWVYRARDPKDEMVALKIMRANHPGAARTQRAAQAVSALGHTGIVRVRSWLQTPGARCVVMDLVDGPSCSLLAERATRTDVWGLDGKDLLTAVGVDVSCLHPDLREITAGAEVYAKLLAHWFASAATALHAAHERGLTHGDIKPSNLLITTDGRMLVSDFAGVDSPHTGPGDGALVSPRWMAPEQIAAAACIAMGVPGARAGPGADMWSLAAVLYELIARRPLWGDGAASHTCEQAVLATATLDPPALRDVERRTPSAIAAICDRALCRDPAKRYANAAQFAEALRLAAGTPVTRLSRWRNSSILRLPTAGADGARP